MMTSNHENGLSQDIGDEVLVKPGSFRLALADPDLDVPVEKLSGIGKKIGERLRAKGVENASDILLLFPRKYRHFDPGKSARYCWENRTNPVSLVGQIKRVNTPPPKSRAPVEVIIESDGVRISLIWFHMNKKWFTSKFVVGEQLGVWGDVAWEKTPPQMAHPDFTSKLGEINEGLEPTYPLVEGLSAKVLRKAQIDAWDRLSDSLIDVVPATLTERYQMIDVRRSLEIIHGFRHYVDIEAFKTDLKLAKERLVYEECFTLQTALAKVYIEQRRVPDAPKFDDESHYRSFVERLPFRMTGDQQNVLESIVTETGSGVRMRRLLQGDVGSGKTVVALGCAELARGNGFQSALMVPSEVLAQQHYTTARTFLEGSGARVGLLTGTLGAAQKRETLALLQRGEIDLIVGTHALFQDDVAFADDGARLGLVVIDEQHKFGVGQREALEAKGNAPHLLAATATPIPRSLAHALFGDLDLTYLKEKPPGRQTIKTYVRDVTRADRVYDYVAKSCHEGERAFVVFPSIDPIDDLTPGLLLGSEQLAAGPFQGLSIGVCHGRMSAVDRQDVMQKFRAGKLDVLCATTVIEVGVDVPEATLMVIDGAERFGLSQLHQLRGRVGRGSKQSICILVVRGSMNALTQQRMDAFESHDDGFDLADIDLQIRGGGEFLGERQSGSGEFRIAHLIRDAEVLVQARRDARSMLFGGE